MDEPDHNWKRRGNRRQRLFLNCEGKKYIEGVNYKNCNLKNPDKSFQLKKLEVFGHGLFSKHFIEKGWFYPALLSWLDLFSLN